MRRYLTIVLLTIGTLLQAANDSTAIFQGFSGGMMLHTGYLMGKDSHAPENMQGQSCSPEGATWGIGGALRINLLKHLRVGGEGFVSTMPSHSTNCRELLQSGSYIRSGWGGVLMDACWRNEKVWPYIGGSMGGGSTRALYILEGNEHDWEKEDYAVFHKQGFLYVNPYVGLDWCMTKKVHLTFRMDWLLAFHQRNLILPTGPRLYVGFMFCH